ncbi:MAG: energy-coupling factor ABC transporter ATP-binding protein [bacterium]
MEKIIEISCLEHIYPDKTVIELCGLEFTVEKGEKVALLGPNGGGKTTLIKHITGLLSSKTGNIKVFGVDPSKDFGKIRHKIGVVFQNAEEQLLGPTVIDDVMFSPLNYGYNKQIAKDMAEAILDRLNIFHLKDKVIHYLSGGEKRKVALAGALIMNPELLILDEPFAALDLKAQRELIKLINSISAEKGLSVVVSTHDVELVCEFADTMYLISSKNKISKKGKPTEIFALDDELNHYNLEKPPILKLFSALKSQGIDIGTPLTIEDAAAVIADVINSKKH